MKPRRARRGVGVLSLLAASGCVALSGLGDLTVDDAAGTDSSVEGTIANQDDRALPGVDTGASSSGETKDAQEPGPDVFIPPPDGGQPDANQPDTGGPETGPAGAGAVQCSQNLQCTDGKACCYSSFYPFPACSTGDCIFGGQGLACDDDSDCSGQVCCITSSLATYSASSACKDACGNNSMHACATGAECGADETCRHVALAPGPIKACQK